MSSMNRDAVRRQLEHLGYYPSDELMDQFLDHLWRQEVSNQLKKTDNVIQNKQEEKRDWELDDEELDEHYWQQSESDDGDDYNDFYEDTYDNSPPRPHTANSIPLWKQHALNDRRPKRTDPVSRWQKYQKEWDHNKFLKGQKKKAAKVTHAIQANPPHHVEKHHERAPHFVPPPEKRRDKLRWSIRRKMSQIH